MAHLSALRMKGDRKGETGMFYELREPHVFNGQDDYLDISKKLHYFLQARTLGLRVVFRLEAAGYGTLLAIGHPDYFLPAFAVCVNMGYVTVMTRRAGRTVICTDTLACNDGQVHELVLNGQEDGLGIWLDGRLIGREREAVPWCEFGYVTVASIGRGIVQNEFRSWYEGEILELSVGTEPIKSSAASVTKGPVKKPLFYKGLAGVENYRIPSLLTTSSGVVIASADARMETPGDNPNHIVRAVRRSTDCGETWEEASLFADFGGCGIESGAAAIDGQLLADEETGTIFMIYSHTPAGVGSWLSEPGTGFEDGRRVLRSGGGSICYQEKDGTVTRADGSASGYTVDACDRLYKDGKEIGSVCLRGGELSIAPTSFLQIVSSRDDGKTWSAPRDLNPMVKAPWMRFLGPGPGTGICIREEKYKGRLVSPVYYSNPDRIYSSGVIYSDDHGVTWQMGRSVNDGRICGGECISADSVKSWGAMLGECQVTELKGGILKLFMRNPGHSRVVSAVSMDGGESFQDFKVENSLVNPYCQFHLLRLEGENGTDPVYLFSGPDHESMRVRGRICCSLDGAESFRKGAMPECGEFSYSCMAELPDKTIGLLYEGRDMTMYFMKMGREELCVL